MNKHGYATCLKCWRQFGIGSDLNAVMSSYFGPVTVFRCAFKMQQANSTFNFFPAPGECMLVWNDELLWHQNSAGILEFINILVVWFSVLNIVLEDLKCISCTHSLSFFYVFVGKFEREFIVSAFGFISCSSMNLLWNLHLHTTNWIGQRYLQNISLLNVEISLHLPQKLLEKHINA